MYITYPVVIMSTFPYCACMHIIYIYIYIYIYVYIYISAVELLYRLSNYSLNKLVGRHYVLAFFLIY